MTSDPTDNPTAPAGSPVIAAIITLVIGLCPFALGIGPLWTGNIHTLSDLVHEVDRRVHHRAEQIDRPKVIFVGGSSVLNGIDARRLGERIGRPVVNYGLIAPMGLDLIAKRASAVIKPGDLVILAAEWEHFRQSDEWTLEQSARLDWLRAMPQPTDDALGRWPSRFWYTAVWRMQSLKRSRELAFRQSLYATLDRLRGRPVKSDAPSDDPAPHHDADGALTLKRDHAIPLTSRARYPSDEDFAHLAESHVGIAFDHLRAACDRVGARLLVMPAIQLDAPGDDAQLRRHVTARWLQYAAQRGVGALVPGGGGPIFDPKYAWDTAYHLNDAGVGELLDRITPPLLDLLNRPADPVDNRD